MQRGGYLEREIPAADGRYWGVGPKGYLQSDVLIAEEISEKMAKDPELQTSGIEISVRYGDVTLRGHVADESYVPRAKQICRSVPGAREVRSKLRVVAKAA